MPADGLPPIRELRSRAAHTGVSARFHTRFSRKTGKNRPSHNKLLHIAYVPVMFMMPRFALAGRGARKPLTTEVFRMAEKVPILVVLGIDIDGKPHASRFTEHDASFVLRAAELMGFHVIRVSAENGELYAVAEGLPLGKIFATGRAFVP